MMERHVDDHATRYALHVPFRYRHSAETTYRRTCGWTRDLNLRGAWVELPETVAAGSTLALVLDTPAGAFPLLADVAWTDPEVRDAPYLHGVRFTGLTPDRRHRLRALLVREHPHLAIRLSCALAATCHRSDHGGPAIPGTVLDLSDTGVGVRLAERVPPGAAVRLNAPTTGAVMNTSSMCLATPPTESPNRMPRPSSYVLPSTNGFSASFGVYSATISGFITNPPAAITTDLVLIAPGVVEVLPATPHDRIAVDDEIRRAGFVPDLHADLVGPLDQQVDHHGRAAEFTGHRHRVPARRGHRLLVYGHTFSLPVYDRPSVLGGMTTLPG